MVPMICTNCGAVTEGRFCSGCGKPGPSTTEAKSANLSLIQRLGLSYLGASTGCGCAIFCLFIPFLWPLAILLLVGIPIYCLAAMLANKTQLQGDCPHCGHSNLVQKGKPGFNCSACKKRVVVDDQRWFVAVG
jgi:hypothetical protein